MDETDNPNRLFSISEVTEATGVAAHLLRQWEERFPQLRPRRAPSGRRVYSHKDIAIARRIKAMLQHEGMTTRGARLRLSQELREVGRPRNRDELLTLVDAIADDARAIIRLFDPDQDEH